MLRDAWGRKAAQGLRGGALAAAACLVGTFGCSEPLDPLTQRCLEALAYRLPGHGDVEQIERGPSSEGWTVTILHAGSPAAQSFSCEYEVGDRWKFRRIVVGERELHEHELTLVNAELFVRDLERSPERFGARDSGPPLPRSGVSAAPPAGPPSAPDA